MGKKIYDIILEMVKKVKEKENALEKKVSEMDKESHLLHNAIDNMIMTTLNHYNVPCEHRLEGHAIVRCKKPPKEISRSKFDPSCKYQWLHYGNVVCINLGYKKK